MTIIGCIRTSTRQGTPTLGITFELTFMLRLQERIREPIGIPLYELSYTNLGPQLVFHPVIIKDPF